METVLLDSLFREAGRREELQHITADHKTGCFLPGGTKIPAATCKHARAGAAISAFIGRGMLRFRIRRRIKRSECFREHGSTGAWRTPRSDAVITLDRRQPSNPHFRGDLSAGRLTSGISLLQIKANFAGKERF